MGARVLFRDSQGRDGEVPLSPSNPLYVGRALDCAVRTDDAMVSRKHSMIRMEGGRFLVEDLGSSNGTHVNDVRVTKHFLSHNDVVRCGSLWLRYVEDGPIAAAAQPAAQAAPVKKHGTMRLDVNQGAAAAQPVASGNQLGYAGTLAPSPAEVQALRSPTAPVAHQPTGYSEHQPPAQPAQPATPYGGPPSMPPEVAQESSVVVDLGAGAVAPADDGLRADLAEAQVRFDELQAKYDREVADGKRLRAETTTLRDRIEDLRRGLAEKDEIAAAHDRVAEELRAELRGAKDQLASVRGELAELGDSLTARERQLDRAQEDIGKLKDEIEDRDRQLAELSRTKDEGWKRLNEQLAEIEHLREVINEQERMLEERRVGLVSQEEVIKELRDAKEASLVDISKVKAERDELRADEGRNQARLTAIDEENRRLARLLAEAQAGGGGDAASTEHAAKISRELKDARVEVKTLESDNARLEDMYRSTEAEVDRLQALVANLEVELREAREEREKALSARGVAEDAMTKAELARAKAAEEALAASQARDTAMSSGDDIRVELERARRRIGELEAAGGGAGSSRETAELEKARADLTSRLRHAEAQLGELEAELARTRGELEAARAKRAEVEDTDTAVVEGTAPAAVVDKAIEVHDNINDVLSEIRNNLMLVAGEWESIAKEDSSDSARIISDTLETLVGNAEEAKGVLRALRELVEYGA